MTPLTMEEASSSEMFYQSAWRYVISLTTYIFMSVAEEIETWQICI